MKYFQYLRVSGAGQVDKDGPQRQREFIEAYTKRHGLEYAGEWFEKGVSGATEAIDRPAFSEMMEYILARKDDIGAIVVERMDRLARDLMVQEFLLAECRKAGVKVFAADQDALIDMASNDGDPTRKLIRQVLGALAEWEKTMLVMKLRKARQRVRAATGRCEGRKSFAEKPHGIVALRLIKSMSDMTPETIARLMNEGGVPTLTGKPWTRFNVYYFREQLKKGALNCT